jgi:hypothetical protein
MLSATKFGLGVKDALTGVYKTFVADNRRSRRRLYASYRRYAWAFHPTTHRRLAIREPCIRYIRAQSTLGSQLFPSSTTARFLRHPTELIPRRNSSAVKPQGNRTITRSPRKKCASGVKSAWAFASLASVQSQGA